MALHLNLAQCCETVSCVKLVMRALRKIEGKPPEASWLPFVFSLSIRESGSSEVEAPTELKIVSRVLKDPGELKHPFILTIVQLYRPFPHVKGGVSRGLAYVRGRRRRRRRGARGEAGTDVAVRVV